jgi:hypothetical protein
VGCRVKGNKALWGQVKPTDVVVEDRNCSPMMVGSIVELVEYGDGHRGLYYVVGFESGGGRGIRAMLARGRLDKWELKAAPARISVRCYAPFVGKGE